MNQRPVKLPRPLGRDSNGNLGRRPVTTRAGFTLTEMLVVIAVIILIASIVTPAFVAMNRGRKVRDAAQMIQGTLVRVRDEAVANNAPAGIRLIPDDTNPELVRSIIVLEGRFTSSAPGTTCHIVRVARGTLAAMQSATVPAGYHEDPTLNPQNDTTALCNMVVGSGGVDWSAFNTGGSIRFEDAGPVYEFQYIDPQHLRLTGLAPALASYTPPLPASAGGPASPVSATDFDTFLKNTPGIHYKIQQYAVPRPGAQPIQLPTGVVIDLGALGPPASPPDRRLSHVMSVGGGSSGPWDILFSPGGQLLPPQNGLLQVGLWIRETDVETAIDASGMKSISTTSSRATLKNALVVINARTGYVTSIEPVYRDLDGDGLYDAQSYYDNATRGDDKGL